MDVRNTHGSLRSQVALHLFLIIFPSSLAMADSGLTFTLNNRIAHKTRMQVEVCSYNKGKFSASNCIEMPSKEAVQYSETGFFHLSESELKKLVDASDTKAIQFRFHDTSAKTHFFWICKEHPYITLDYPPLSKRFHIELTGSHPVSYRCRIFREEDSLFNPEEAEEPVVDRIIQNFTEYRKWVQNEEGLTFTIQNNIKDPNSKLKVRVCNHAPLNLNHRVCIYMNDNDSIHHNQTRIYHMDRHNLKTLVDASKDKNKIEFDFLDTKNPSGKYKPCYEHPFNQLEVVSNNGHHGHRFTITVNEMGEFNPYCTIQTK